MHCQERSEWSNIRNHGNTVDKVHAAYKNRKIEQFGSAFETFSLAFSETNQMVLSTLYNIVQ